jgi:pSer/pThr/pTyr-binding forkhead associated (FHA) protein
LAKLVLSLNGTVLNQHFLDKPCISIGRDAASDIVINDPLLSREHARVVSIGEDHIVEDLHSGNGTLVNGQPLLRQILQHRDVIALGSHHLCYVNTRMAGEVDLERTMLIQAMPRYRDPDEDTPVVAVPAMRTPKARLPEGSIKVLAGQGRHVVGKNVRLDRVVTTFGIPGEQLVVVARRPQGYFLTHVEGAKLPRVNQRAIGIQPYALSDGDEIEAAGCWLEFRLGAFGESK